MSPERWEPWIIYVRNISEVNSFNTRACLSGDLSVLLMMLQMPNWTQRRQHFSEEQQKYRMIYH